MWTPPYNVMPDDERRRLVEEMGSAELVTVGADGFPMATRLPVLWLDDRLILHMAIANPQWRTITDRTPALAVVTGPEAYVSPSYYAAKAEHGRVVPTWNYSAIHFTGRATVHRDPEWLHRAVRDLTDRHEQRRAEPWAVGDAPETFIAQQLKAIVGVELVIERVDARAKRSQNRSTDDRLGVIAGLREDGPGRSDAMADRMERDLTKDMGL